MDKAKDLARDYLVDKADDAKDTLKTIGKVADTAGEFIKEKKQEAEGRYSRSERSDQRDSYRNEPRYSQDKRVFNNLY